jgi:hypothetical protein
MTHTPGPWTVENWSYENGAKIVPTIKSGTDAVAEILDLWCPDDRKGERAANADLIAAAPDMLAALEYAADRLEAWADHHQIVARGMSDGPECSSQMNICKNYGEIAQTARAAIDKAKGGIGHA